MQGESAAQPAGDTDFQERDINDAFDDITLYENKVYAQAFHDGFDEGAKQENTEVFRLGFQQGVDLGAEIGYYIGVTQSYLKFLDKSPGDEKIVKELLKLKEILDDFPKGSYSEANLLELVTKVKEPFLGFANCHMVDFFTKSAFKSFIPTAIQNEIDQSGQGKIVSLLLTNNFEGVPHLRKFIDSTVSFTLKNCSDVCLNLDTFVKKLEDCGCDINRFKLEIFMTAKKSHEVEILSAVASAISKVSQTSHVIDIGDGKGYLSSMLALHHKMPVLGVDASNVNTCGAIKRVNKLSKIWNNIPNAPHKSLPKKNENCASPNVQYYKQVTEFVDENFDLEKLVLDNFPTSRALRLGLVGLHTCGNLAPNSLKIYISNKSVKSICNVGCCYHLVNENSTNENAGFPMSNFLAARRFSIGRSARMIANQSVDRVLQSQDLPNITIFYRALLQVILERYCDELPSKHVGKFRKLPDNFLDYARTAMKKIEVTASVTDEQILEVYENYKDRLTELNIFYLLRCKLAPVVESLILLDRLLFLKEQGFEGSFLVQLFDPVVSPRCYGIVSLKDFVIK